MVDFHPDTLLKNVAYGFQKLESSEHVNDFEESVTQDLMKLLANRSTMAPEVPSSYSSSITVNQYSAYLSELLYILDSDASIDENHRGALERGVFELTSFIPNPMKMSDDSQYVLYPNEQISKILIDNFHLLLKLGTSYYNLSLSTHIVKYLVKLVYALQYWEVYHLLCLIPEFEGFLKLLEIEVYQTPFGPLVRPPKNLLIDSMAQGLEYPFPYPFYDYSYHSFDPDEVKRKFKRIKIRPYSGLELSTSGHKNVKKVIINESNQTDVVKETPKPPKSQKMDAYGRKSFNEKSSNFHIDGGNEATSRAGKISALLNTPVIGPNEGAAENLTETPVRMDTLAVSKVSSEENINDGVKSSSSSSSPEIQKPDGQDTNSPSETLDESIISYTSFTVAESASKESKSNEDNIKKSKTKSGVIHQCHLIDPHSLKPCLKIFYGKNELLRHQEFVHATRKKIYKCIYCSRNGNKVQSYPRHDSLARHIRRKHGVTGKENKMAVNYAKENVEIIEDPTKFPSSQVSHYSKPLPRPQFLNNDFTIKPDYAGFLSFSTRDSTSKANFVVGNQKGGPSISELNNPTTGNNAQSGPSETPQSKQTLPETPSSMMTHFASKAVPSTPLSVPSQPSQSNIDSTNLKPTQASFPALQNNPKPSTAKEEQQKFKFQFQPAHKYNNDKLSFS